MKLNDKKQLHAKDISELKLTLKEANDALTTLQFEKMQRKEKNTRAIFHKRKAISVIKTILREKELIGEKLPVVKKESRKGT